MLVLLSPAKTLDYDKALPPVEPSVPRLGDAADDLARAAAGLDAPALQALMRISPRLAALNVDRYRSFADQPERPALFAFAGDVYAGLEAHSLPDEALPFAQAHLRILSGLYGLLRPLDAIRPYRLEMGTRWSPAGGKLTDWWDARIADLLAADIAAEGSGEVLNLASQEYWAAVDGRLPATAHVVAVDFREHGPRGLRFNSFAAKRARGTMARWVVEHRIERLADLGGFDSDGYAHDPDASTAEQLRFVRG